MPTLTEEEIYNMMFDLQTELQDYVEDHYQKWTIPQKQKDKLSKMFWDLHKISCTQMLFDDVEEKICKAQKEKKNA